MSNTVLHLRILQMFKPLSQVFRKRTHSKRYDNEWGVFNSHEWGTSMATHSKALKIAQILEEQHNLKVWLDDHEIQGMVDVAMSRGIKGSKVFPILGTERWMKTINSGDRKDNSSRQVAVLGALDECGKSQQFLDEVVVQRWTQELPPWLCLVLSTRPRKKSLNLCGISIPPSLNGATFLFWKTFKNISSLPYCTSLVYLTHGLRIKSLTS